jgi:ornithine carbamoyltransferase
MSTAPKAIAKAIAKGIPSTVPTGAPPVRHYLQFADFSTEEYGYLLERAAFIKAKFKTFERHHTLVDRTLAMIFEKASTRTRVSFEAGMYQLGGSVVHLTTGDSQLGRAEPIEDSARVISRMTDIVMIRTYEQTKIERFAAHSRVPVINGLTNEFHPCQILADIFTYTEHRGPIAGKTVTWVGDGNNMANTWLQAAALLGFHLRVSTPNGYELDEEVAVTPHGMGAGSYKTYSNPLEACTGADLVTTDVWTSMGYEAENDARRTAFAAWCVDAKMIAAAKPDALFMHCLPAHRGEEVAADVIDGPQSVVWDEAENRMHVQKALMEYLLLGRQD